MDCSSWIRILDPDSDFYPPIPDPGSRGQDAPDPGYAILICTNFYLERLVHSLETSQAGNEHIGGVEKLLTFNHRVVGTRNLK
jgi:hypothetical protein